MGLLKGSFTFARFHVEGQLPQAFLNFINSRIKANSFTDKFKSMEEKRLGWVSLTDVLDTDFENANYALGDYLIFSLRIDRKLISPKLMKIKLMEEERRLLAESGKNRINKSMAMAIKDKVKLELLTKLDAIPSFYDVCWAVGKNTIYFSSLSDKVADDFVDLFKKSFSLNLRRFLPQENNLISTKSESTEAASLIGREFLTWLWFKSEERNGRIALINKEEVELHFLKRIVLEAERANIPRASSVTEFTPSSKKARKQSVREKKLKKRELN